MTQLENHTPESPAAGRVVLLPLIVAPWVRELALALAERGGSVALWMVDASESKEGGEAGRAKNEQEQARPSGEAGRADALNEAEPVVASGLPEWALALQLAIHDAGGISLAAPAALLADALGHLDAAVVADPPQARQLGAALNDLERRVRPAAIYVLDAETADLETLRAATQGPGRLNFQGWPAGSMNDLAQALCGQKPV